MAEAEFAEVRGVDIGVGGFVDKADPRNFGVYVFARAGSRTAGAGVTFHLTEDFEASAQSALGPGVRIVRSPKEDPIDYSRQLLKYFHHISRIPTSEEWLKNQIDAQNREFERQGSSVRLVDGRKY